MTTIQLDDYVAIVTVACRHTNTPRTQDASWHRIGVKADGRLVFFDHFGLMGTEIALFKLAQGGALPHTCASILKQWIDKDYSLPAELKAAREVIDTQHAEKISRRYTHRCRTHREGYRGNIQGKPQVFDASGVAYANEDYREPCARCADDPLLLSARKRFAARTAAVARSAAFHITRLREGSDGHKTIVRVDWYRCHGCNHGYPESRLFRLDDGEFLSPCCSLWAYRHAWALGESERDWSPMDQRYHRTSTAELYITPHWLVRVHQKGLAVVDGYFVLDASAHHDRRGERYLLLVVRPGRGFSLSTKRAWYRPDDGKLRWV